MNKKYKKSSQATTYNFAQHKKYVQSIVIH